MKLYFVRHGQTYLNKYGKMQGWSDSPLTDDGENVARETGQRLKDIPFSALYTSDLGRTIQTAKIISSANNFIEPKDIQPLEELRETFFGSFEADHGKDVYPKIAEKVGISVKDLFGKLSLSDISKYMKELDPYGDVETAEEFKERLNKGLEIITETTYQVSEPIILIVTHGNIIRHLVKEISPETNVSIEIENSSITIIDYKNGVFKLEEFNT